MFPASREPPEHLASPAGRRQCARRSPPRPAIPVRQENPASPAPPAIRAAPDSLATPADLETTAPPALKDPQDLQETPERTDEKDPEERQADRHSPPRHCQEIQEFPENPDHQDCREMLANPADLDLTAFPDRRDHPDPLDKPASQERPAPSVLPASLDPKENEVCPFFLFLINFRFQESVPSTVPWMEESSSRTAPDDNPSRTAILYPISDPGVHSS